MGKKQSPELDESSRKAKKYNAPRVKTYGNIRDITQSLKPNGVVPVALQDYVTVHGDNDAVDYISSEQTRCGSRQQKQRYEMGELSHQNACPILKKKLK